MAKNKEASIRPKLQKLLSDTLQEGEQVLWTGRRTFLLSFSETVAEKILVSTIILLLFPITIPALLLQLRELSNTLYVITNRRILIIVNRGKNKVATFDLSSLQQFDMQLKERKDGVGTLIFNIAMDYREVPTIDGQAQNASLLEIDLSNHPNAKKIRFIMAAQADGNNKLRYAIIADDEDNFKLEEVANARQVKELLEQTFDVVSGQSPVLPVTEWPRL